MLAIDIRKERLYPLRDLRKVIHEKTGMRVSYLSLFRYIRYGRKVPLAEDPVKMDKVHFPTGMHSSVEAFLRFIEEINENS